MSRLSTNAAFIHKLANLCKDFNTYAGIRDMFIYAGADRDWFKEPTPNPEITSSKVAQVYGWIEGLNEYTPDQADKILVGVATQLLESERVQESDKTMLRRLAQDPLILSSTPLTKVPDAISIPDDVESLLEILINGIPRAMYPLKNLRGGQPSLEFDNEYDIQTLIHVLVRPWIKDIRPEEYTPSYAGSSTRIDFLLPKYSVVLEVKFVRDKRHAIKIGDELIIDIAHYKAHPRCKQLWGVIYDPQDCIQNPKGLISDLERHSENIKVRVFVLGTGKA